MKRKKRNANVLIKYEGTESGSRFLGGAVAGGVGIIKTMSSPGVVGSKVLWMPDATTGGQSTPTQRPPTAHRPTSTILHIFFSFFVVIKTGCKEEDRMGAGTRADNKKCFTFQSTNNMAFNGQAKRARPKQRATHPPIPATKRRTGSNP